MPAALLRPCLKIPLIIPLAVLLSVCMGVGGCGCPSSSSVALNGSKPRALMSSAAAHAPAAGAAACLVAFAMAGMKPLLIWLLLEAALPKKLYPPARDRAIGATKHAAPERLRGAMPLALAARQLSGHGRAPRWEGQAGVAGRRPQ